MKRCLTVAAILLAAIATPAAPVHASQPPSHCWVWYYIGDGGTYDHVKAGCTDVAPGYMVQVQAYLNDKKAGGMRWVRGPWVDCNWKAATPNAYLSVVKWRAIDFTGRFSWVTGSKARYVVLTDSDTTEC